MARKNSAEKAMRWGEILNRQAGSGVSVRQFCETEGISQPSFYAWRKRLRDREHNDTRPRKSKGPEDALDRGRLFVPLQLLDSAAMLEIIHPHGCRIQVTGDVNPVALRHVLAALDERGAR